MTDYINLGPELFATGDEKVITWMGENYYKSCNAPVYAYPANDPDGRAQSYCVKRDGHPGQIHEDYEGRKRDDSPVDLRDLSLEDACYKAIAAATGCWENMSGAGIFDSDRAKAIADALIQRILDFGPIYG